MEEYSCPYCLRPAAKGTRCPDCGRETQKYEETPAWYLQPETVLNGRYRIGRVIGHNSYETTYAALDLRWRRAVKLEEYFPMRCSLGREKDGALSPYREEDGLYRKGMEAFERSAAMLMREPLKTMSVQVRGVFRENNTAYRVVDAPEGRTLAEVVRRDGPMEMGRLFAGMWPLLRDLQALHGAYILHREITPENVLMTQDGSLVLTGFGSWYPPELDPNYLHSLPRWDPFAAAEAQMNRPSSPSMDVYGLCATMYYALTGQAPPDAPSRVMEDTMAPPSALGAKIGAAQEKALLRGMAPEPKDRIQSVAQLIKELTQAPPTPSPAGPMERTKRGFGAMLEKLTRAPGPARRAQ